MVEFALILPILVFLVMGVIELSWYMHLRYDVQRAAQVGARIGSMVLEGPDPDGTDIIAAAEEHAELVLDAAGVDCELGCTIEARWVKHDNDWMIVEVDVDVHYHRLIPGMDLVPTVLVGRFKTITLQQMPSG